MPMRRRSGGSVWRGVLTTSPSSRISPAARRSKPAMQRSTVVLPQPEGPSRQPIRPFSRLRESWRTTRWSAEGEVDPVKVEV